MQTSPAAPHRRVKLAGAIILLAGWLVAAVVYFVAGRDDDANGTTYRIVNGQSYAIASGDSKADTSAAERIGGLASVRTAAFDDWLGSLWHGQRLAYALAAIASVIALGCFHVGGLMAEEVGLVRPHR